MEKIDVTNKTLKEIRVLIAKYEAKGFNVTYKKDINNKWWFTATKQGGLKWYEKLITRLSKIAGVTNCIIKLGKKELK